MTRRKNFRGYFCLTASRPLIEVSHLEAVPNYYIAIFIYALIFTFELSKCSQELNTLIFLYNFCLGDHTTASGHRGFYEAKTHNFHVYE